MALQVNERKGWPSSHCLVCVVTEHFANEQTFNVIGFMRQDVVRPRCSLRLSSINGFGKTLRSSPLSWSALGRLPPPDGVKDALFPRRVGVSVSGPHFKGHTVICEN